MLLFVTREHAEFHSDVIRRMQEEGNLIGNHTYSHKQSHTDKGQQPKEI